MSSFFLSPADIFDAEMSDENDDSIKENKTNEVKHFICKGKQNCVSRK